MELLLMIGQKQTMQGRGFSLKFCRTLLGKLNELKKEDRIYKEKTFKEAEKGGYNELTPIARSVIYYLIGQVQYTKGVDMSFDPSDVNELIFLAEEFLAIFKK